MRAFITGGAGFIGSHLAEKLLNHGWEVAVLDDLSTGSMSNIAHLKQESRFHYVIDTAMNRRLVAEMVDECDMVFHLAAAVGVRLIVESPVRTLHTNVGATEIVLEAASKKKKKVLITSTSEVYGKSEQIPFREDGDLVIGAPVRGRWSYACSKALDEFLAISYQREKNVPVVIARLFNTVGPRQSGMYGMVLPRFVGQALRGQPITIYGDGEQTRSFSWVGDIVSALVRLSLFPDAEGRVFNIGSDQEVTINELAQVVKDVTSSDSRIEHLTYEQVYGKDFEDMPRRVPDLSRIRSAIGFAPSKRLHQIVEAVADSLNSAKAALPENLSIPVIAANPANL